MRELRTHSDFFFGHPLELSPQFANHSKSSVGLCCGMECSAQTQEGFSRHKVQRHQLTCWQVFNLCPHKFTPVMRCLLSGYCVYACWRQTQTPTAACRGVKLNTLESTPQSSAKHSTGCVRLFAYGLYDNRSRVLHTSQPHAHTHTRMQQKLAYPSRHLHKSRTTRDQTSSGCNGELLKLSVTQMATDSERELQINLQRKIT